MVAKHVLLLSVVKMWMLETLLSFRRANEKLIYGEVNNCKILFEGLKWNYRVKDLDVDRITL
jgi:hypothetical protein